MQGKVGGLRLLDCERQRQDEKVSDGVLCGMTKPDLLNVRRWSRQCFCELWMKPVFILKCSLCCIARYGFLAAFLASPLFLALMTSPPWPLSPNPPFLEMSASSVLSLMWRRGPGSGASRGWDGRWL
jgi:hypothetical protein